MISILKQLTSQLNGLKQINDNESLSLLFPFNSSKDYYVNQSIAFKDPINSKEHLLSFKNDDERLNRIKKINTAITSYNKMAIKNYKKYISIVPADGKVHSAEELGFKEPTITFKEHPIWGFKVSGRLSGNNKLISIIIDNRKLYQKRMNSKSDIEFITYLNCEIFNYIQIQRKESERLGTWDVNNLWYNY